MANIFKALFNVVLHPSRNTLAKASTELYEEYISHKLGQGKDHGLSNLKSYLKNPDPPSYDLSNNLAGRIIERRSLGAYNDGSLQFGNITKQSLDTLPHLNYPNFPQFQNLVESIYLLHSNQLR